MSKKLQCIKLLVSRGIYYVFFVNNMVRTIHLLMTLAIKEWWPYKRYFGCLFFLGLFFFYIDIANFFYRHDYYTLASIYVSVMRLPFLQFLHKVLFGLYSVCPFFVHGLLKIYTLLILYWYCYCSYRYTIRTYVRMRKNKYYVWCKDIILFVLWAVGTFYLCMGGWYISAWCVGIVPLP